jgi:hypothetical protein
VADGSLSTRFSITAARRLLINRAVGTANQVPGTTFATKVPGGLAFARQIRPRTAAARRSRIGCLDSLLRALPARYVMSFVRDRILN